MKIAQYEDIPDLGAQLLIEIETTGISVEIWKDERPMARMIPIDEATRSQFEAKRRR